MEPKRAKLKEAEDSLEKANKTLQEKQDSLKAVEDRVESELPSAHEVILQGLSKDRSIHFRALQCCGLSQTVSRCIGMSQLVNQCLTNECSDV